MFHYWKKVDSLNHINRFLLAFVSVLILIVLGLIITLAKMPSRFEFWLTPTMSMNGGLIKENEISKEYIQGFVASLLPVLNTWSNGGQIEFANNLSGFNLNKSLVRSLTNEGKNRYDNDSSDLMNENDCDSSRDVENMSNSF